MTMASTYRLSRSFKLMRRDTVVLCIPLNCHNDAFLSGALRTFPTLPELLSRNESLPAKGGGARSEEHTSELQSLMRNSYAVFCLQKKIMNNKTKTITRHYTQ